MTEGQQELAKAITAWIADASATNAATLRTSIRRARVSQQTASELMRLLGLVADNL